MKSCKICIKGTAKELKKIKSPYFELFYTLYHCDDCESRFFDYEEHDVSIDEMYERIAPIHITSEDKFRKSMYWNKQKNSAIKTLGHYPESVLDVGCRTGDFLLHFDEKKILLEGVELSEYSAKIAEKRGLKIYNDFLEKIEFNQKYDIVSAFAIIEHLLDPHKFLEKLNNLVNKNGILIIMIPSYECVKESILTSIDYRWHMYSPPEHLNFYSKKFLDTYLKENGFRLVNRFNTSGGIFNPFKKVPVFNKAFGLSMRIIDYYSPVKNVALFDHLYSFYVKET